METAENKLTQDQTGLSCAPPLIDAVYDKHRLYRIIDAEGETVERTAKEIAQGSKMMSNIELFVANLQSTLERVRRWCIERQDQLRGALVDIRSTKVIFYIVPVSEHYVMKLGDDMTALEVELGGSAGIGYVESLQIPVRSLQRFAGPKSLIVWMREDDPVFAEPTATPA